MTRQEERRLRHYRQCLIFVRSSGLVARALPPLVAAALPAQPVLRVRRAQETRGVRAHRSVFEVVPQSAEPCRAFLSGAWLTRARGTMASGLAFATGSLRHPGGSGGLPPPFRRCGARTHAPASAESVEPPLPSEDDADVALLPRPRPSAPQPLAANIATSDLVAVCPARAGRPQRRRKAPACRSIPGPPRPRRAPKPLAAATEQPRQSPPCHRSLRLHTAARRCLIAPARAPLRGPPPIACAKPVADRDGDFSRTKPR